MLLTGEEKLADQRKKRSYICLLYEYCLLLTAARRTFLFKSFFRVIFTKNALFYTKEEEK
ncbi:MAG TPA: hypothetical protein DD452_08190 [Nitrospina sp.]|nr:hypothetical protein [Nitrospina sp.]HCK68265.1 hypothetical protein [Nitrospina sp.]